MRNLKNKKNSNNMKRILVLFVVVLTAQGLLAQPAARRAKQQAQAQKSNADNVTQRAQIMFPTAPTMSEDVVWRRDIYRELDLTQDANAGLYYPVEPIGTQMNLFTYIFKLMMTGQVKAYEYRLDGNELFSDSARIKPLAFLENYHIFYERVNGRVRIDNSDIPSREVTAYYIKESAYYDQATATFHTKVLALCPILKREDDFGDGTTAYPLFWVKYEDLAPFLTKQTIMTSNLNNAATMSMDDYFTRTQYRGKIYKTNNMLGRTLAQYCPTEEKLTAEQRRIEAEIAQFEKNMWGDPARKDSLAKAAVEEKNAAKDKKSKSNRRSGSSKTKTAKAKSPKSSSGSSGNARISVRRERH